MTKENKSLDKNRVLDLIDSGIERSIRWEEDAKIREDELDQQFYAGGQKVLIDIKSIIERW